MSVPTIVPIEWPDEINKLYLFKGEYYNQSSTEHEGIIALIPFIIKEDFMSFTSTGSGGFIYHDTRDSMKNIGGKKFGNGQFYKVT